MGTKNSCLSKFNIHRSKILCLCLIEFTHECATTFKETKAEFEDITTVNLQALRHLLKEIEANDCFFHPSQKSSFNAKINQLEGTISVWVNDITLRLKVLVEEQINVLDDSFQQICEKLNAEKIKAKG